MLLHVLLLLILPRESWNYYSKLPPTLVLAGLGLLRLRDATSRAANRSTKGDLDVSSYWMTPDARYMDLYLIVVVAAPQLYAN